MIADTNFMCRVAEHINHPLFGASQRRALCIAFKVPPSTVDRWASGTSTPGVSVRIAVLKIIKETL